MPPVLDTKSTRLALSSVQKALQAYRYRFSSEEFLHRGIALALGNAGLAFEHEWVASAQCRFDFLLPDSGIVIEVKVAGAYGEALRQARRYLELVQCTAVLVASSKLWAPLDPAPESDILLSGKPLRVLRLQKQVF